MSYFAFIFIMGLIVSVIVAVSFIASMITIHKSQKLIATEEDGSQVFELDVVINQELHREFFGYVDAVRVLSPQSLADFMRLKFGLAKGRYEE